MQRPDAGQQRRGRTAAHSPADNDHDPSAGNHPSYVDHHEVEAHQGQLLQDADANGVPCETVYGKQGGSGQTTDPRWGQTCEEIGHPYTALPGDPHDGDHDGIACED